MFVDYAVISVRVKAQDSDINGPDEIKLSDAIWAMEGELAQWLKERFGDKFEFTVEGS